VEQRIDVAVRVGEFLPHWKALPMLIRLAFGVVAPPLSGLS
jgi:hypothetical protein